jgi:hypothetical protein
VTENRKVIQAARDRHLHLVRQLYELTGGVGVEAHGLSSAVIGETFGVNENVFERVRKSLRAVGALSVRFTAIPLADGGGRIAHWTLTKPYEEVEALIRAMWNGANGEAKDDIGLPGDMSPEAAYVAGIADGERVVIAKRDSEEEPLPAPKPKAPDTAPVVIAKRDSEEVRAIAGPDNESPFAGIRVLRRDESAAYVAAAKQYSQRSTLIDTKLKELEDAGIVVDRTAIHFARDEQFEAVGQALPYITALENTVKNLEASVADLQRKSKDLPELRHRVEAQKRQIDRMVAAKVNANA